MSARNAIGRTAALAVAIETLVFGISLIWEVVEFATVPRLLGYVASLVLAPSVVVMNACFYDGIRDSRRICGLLALAASILYAPFCMGTYFVQLAVVELNPLDLSNDVVEAIAFKPGSVTFALDMLGYGFLCLSTLAAGFALKDPKDKALRFLCFFHGALVVPTFAAPIISGFFLSDSGETDTTGHYVLLFWCVVFAPLALLFRRHFREETPARTSP